MTIDCKVYPISLFNQRMSRRSMPSGLTRGWVRFAGKDMRGALVQIAPSGKRTNAKWLG
jgi:hypothetical protein